MKETQNCINTSFSIFIVIMWWLNMNVKCVSSKKKKIFLLFIEHKHVNIINVNMPWYNYNTLIQSMLKTNIHRPSQNYRYEFGPSAHKLLKKQTPLSYLMKIKKEEKKNYDSLSIERNLFNSIHCERPKRKTFSKCFSVQTLNFEIGFYRYIL